MKSIKKVLISVYDKSHLIELVNILKLFNPEFISTGGTKTALEELGCNVTSVQDITKYPSILGGRVKTLHPKIFGSILCRSDNPNDTNELNEIGIEKIDMVVVDLYPFQQTVSENANHEAVIEKIDIGGVSLIRAAAKNYNDIFIVPSINHFKEAAHIINSQNGKTSIENRVLFAKKAFEITSEYENSISEYFSKKLDVDYCFSKIIKKPISNSKILRYGENPHQSGKYYGDLNQVFDQLSGKELSYNNLLDVDAAVNLIEEFDEVSFGILKHNNACGFSSDNNIADAWGKALAGDPISAFGGVLITNSIINNEVAEKINELFFEVLIAKDFSKKSLELLKSKKSRIILRKKNSKLDKVTFRSILNGILYQEKDFITDQDNIRLVSSSTITKKQMNDLIFASKICKHTKSNAIVLVKNKQLLGAGCGQTSRVDALKQAILKAKGFNFSLENAVMASDAFFPFSDCVEIAHKEGINAVIQPGGSKNDQLSIDFCNKNQISMLFTGNRHFKH